MNMVKSISILAFVLIVSASTPITVSAAEKPSSKPLPASLGGFSLTPTIGGYYFAKSEQRDTIQTYGLKIGYETLGKSLSDNLGIECTVNYFATKSKVDASDASGYIFRLDALYPFILGTKWMPFLAVGAGGINIDSASHDDTSPLLNYGVGLKYFPVDYLAVRVDARHLFVYDNVSTRNNFEAGFGLSYYFGKESKKTEPLPSAKQEEQGVVKKNNKATDTEINPLR